MFSWILLYSPLTYVVSRVQDFIRISAFLIKRTSEGPSSDYLTVIDHRTARRYQIPIAHNAIQAIHLQEIYAGRVSDISNRVKNGLRVLDPGFQNTAVTVSRITSV